MANTEATNGKPLRDLGFQDTGKQGVGVGLREERSGRADAHQPKPGGSPLCCIQSHRLLRLLPSGTRWASLIFKAGHILGRSPFMAGGV